MKLCYGIIATSSIVPRFIGAVRATGGTVRAVASRSLERARQFCGEYQIPKAYGSYEELLQDEQIMVVYIASINMEHASQIRLALEAGKHVLCEKPLTLSYRQAASLFALAGQKQLFLMEMQKSLFLPVTKQIKAYLSSGTMGCLRQVVMNAAFANPVAPWMHDPKQGGVVYGSASYTIEYLDYLIEPERIAVQVIGTKEASGTVDAVSINLKLDEVLVNSRISMNIESESQAEFFFDQGWIKVPYYWKAAELKVFSNGSAERFEYPIQYEMCYEVEHVQNCLEQGLTESPVMTARRTLNCIRIVEQLMDQLNNI